MKSREEIDKLIHECLDRDNWRAAMFVLMAAQLELLCDIRDLLMKPQTVTVNLSGNICSEAELVEAIQHGLAEAARRGRL